MRAPVQKGYRSLNLTLPWDDEGKFGDKIIALESKTGISLRSVGHNDHIHLYIAVMDLEKVGRKL